MAKVNDDEMLMAYADGALSPALRAKVEAFLKASPEARRRVEIFRATGAPISKLYSKPMTEPVPAHLRDFVLNFEMDAAPPKVEAPGASLVSKARRLASRFEEWLTSPGPKAVRWQFAAAAVGFLALGVGAGSFLHSGESASDGDLVAFQDGHIYASGALRNVLEETASRHDSRIGGVRGDAVTMRANLTFKSTEQTYCREYEIEAPGAHAFVGLGCRDRNGNWAIEAHMPSEAKAKGIKAAGHNTALDAVVDRMIDGDAFGEEQEAAAIKNGWK